MVVIQQSINHRLSTFFALKRPNDNHFKRREIANRGHNTVKSNKVFGGYVGTDTRPGMLRNYFRSAICVQNFDDSLSCAIHITYRSSQRSSSIHEPRDPPLKVVRFVIFSYQSSKRLLFLQSSNQKRFFRIKKKALLSFCKGLGFVYSFPKSIATLQEEKDKYV